MTKNHDINNAHNIRNSNEKVHKTSAVDHGHDQKRHNSSGAQNSSHGKKNH